MRLVHDLPDRQRQVVLLGPPAGAVPRGGRIHARHAGGNRPRHCCIARGARLTAAAGDPCDMTLDARLRNLYRGLDASPGFDARVMARMSVELDAKCGQNAARARAEEERRYELARRTQSWEPPPAPRRDAGRRCAGRRSRAASSIASGGDRPLALAPLGVTALGIVLALAAPPLLLQCHRRMSRP